MLLKILNEKHFQRSGGNNVFGYCCQHCVADLPYIAGESSYPLFCFYAFVYSLWIVKNLLCHN